MLKIKRIKLSGFRGMLNPQEISLVKDGGVPCSFVLFGANSSGKTSFVDGLEWFLSKQNRIEWLQREEAGPKAYCHQEAKEDESFVEIEFNDSENKIGTLTKFFNNQNITQPTLSSTVDFNAIYKSFIIKPFLRYSEVIDFIYNNTGVQKYRKLAEWMGFEEELSFQEKITLNIIPGLRRNQEEISKKVEYFEEQLKSLTGNQGITETEVLKFCNGVLKSYRISPAGDINNLWEQLKEFNKLKSSSSVGIKVNKLTEVESLLSTSSFNSDLVNILQELKEKITEIKKEQRLIEKIDTISLYTCALDLLTKTTEVKTKCPLCGTDWEKESLLKHIQEQFLLLEKVRQSKEDILQRVSTIKGLIKEEKEIVRQVIVGCEEIEKIIPSLTYEKIKEYKGNSDNIEDSLTTDLFTKDIETQIESQDMLDIIGEKKTIVAQIKSEKIKIQPSKAELQLSVNTEKLNKIEENWRSLSEIKSKLLFITEEIGHFVDLSEEVIKLIKEDIKNRFNEISECIGRYFSVLRNDKEIKDIEIKLKEAGGRAVGRSAEFQLSYYNFSVKPAYKVLSESLLNNLGISIYLACVKKFNTECKFIVLDDIMNSLDAEKRDTLLDLIKRDFDDFQVVLFTHDYYWFQKIKRIFPDWITKKIKGWNYLTGPKIEIEKTTKEEIENLLSDSTKTPEAGLKLAKYIEDTLNMLCQDLWAKVVYRYTKNDPPAMEELFNSLYTRLKDNNKDHPVVQKLLEVKKYEPLLRNFLIHSREADASPPSPAEVKRAMDEWFELEEQLYCSSCQDYVKYHPTKDLIECYCGKLNLSAPKSI